jgi:hypothetical protein
MRALQHLNGQGVSVVEFRSFPLELLLLDKRKHYAEDQCIDGRVGEEVRQKHTCGEEE